MSFNDYDLDPLVLKHLKRQGIEEPTPIQAKSIPVALEGRDILAISQTGSGKTLAFALPALTCLDEDPPGRNRMLVLTPTRELCEQVYKVVESVGRILELKTVCIYGGVGIDRQTKTLRKGVDIIIATPGRLIDHIERGNIDFNKLSTLVLDEADRMMDMGFMPDIKRILNLLPENRQTMLFSATFPKEIEKLAQQFLFKPERIEIGRVAPAKAVRQELYAVEQNMKQRLLEKILGESGVDSAIVFMRTKHRTDRVAKAMKKIGVKIAIIHGGRTQAQRKAALDGFRKGKVQVLMATDVAARGIDIQGVTHVINYDIPTAFDDYVHRIGRTARASADGDAITFVTPDEAKTLRAIENGLGAPIPRAEWVGDVKLDTAASPSRAKVASPKSHTKKRGPKGSTKPKSRSSVGPKSRKPREQEAGESRPAKGRTAERSSADGRPSEGRPTKKKSVRKRPSRKPAGRKSTKPGGQSSENRSSGSPKPSKGKNPSRRRKNSDRPNRSRANA